MLDHSDLWRNITQVRVSWAERRIRAASLTIIEREIIRVFFMSSKFSFSLRALEPVACTASKYILFSPSFVILFQ